MQYTKLGNSHLTASRICMGCMGFGDPRNGQHSWTLDEEHSRQIIRRGLELGVNFFDTAVGGQGGGRHGTEYPGRRERAACLEHRQPKNPRAVSFIQALDTER